MESNLIDFSPHLYGFGDKQIKGELSKLSRERLIFLSPLFMILLHKGAFIIHGFGVWSLF